jgi:hypothetical protein
MADFLFRSRGANVGHGAEGSAFRFAGVRSSSSLFPALPCSAGFYVSALAPATVPDADDAATWKRKSAKGKEGEESPPFPKPKA